MSFLRHVLIPFVLALSAVTAFAGSGGGGGAGVRGGSGFIDRITGHPVLWEEFEIRGRGGQPSRLDPNALRAKLGPKYRELGDRIVATWAAFGSPRTWQPFEPAAVDHVDDEALEIDRYAVALRVQIALAARRRPGARPRLNPVAANFSDVSLDLVRLHEAAYSVGDERYGHTFSRLTRRLIVAWLAPRDADELERAARDFVGAPADLARIVGDLPVLAGLRSGGLALKASGPLAAGCADFTVKFAGGRDLLVCRNLLGLFADRSVSCRIEDYERFKPELNSGCGYRAPGLDP